MSAALLWLVLLGALLPRPAGTKPSDTCNRHRQVLTAPWGIITDGNDSYRNDSHCEWLVRADASRPFITLRFHEMETECAYDHVFIYDGDSYEAPLLGTFSGRTLPAPVTASSGAVSGPRGARARPEPALRRCWCCCTATPTTC